MGRLAGKVAIVTGAAQGQGAAIARAYVAEGAKVALADIADDLGKALADELGPDAIYVHHDVSDEDSWKAVVEETVRAFGPVTVLVNNAGVLTFAELPTMELAEFQRLISVNMVGCFLGMKTVAPVMKTAGGGSIVNCSSVEGLGGMPSLVAYTGTKFAVRGMTKAAAMELGPSNIRVNSVHPGMVDTNMTRSMAGDEGMAWAAKRVALRRVGTPETIAPMYVFLASEESSFSTGAEFVADGGATATHAFGG
ncbi:glucose 1-dehydrogenase [Nocardioides sp. HDW12B]|uniref:glucose 1-dehydrogenase n=1 Tax=Nocardioides sp. HDW12B TaxID=2714939 RepID=UPI00140D7136|nr:glucose 1-dehydrogenase [Nocardioides sp. HDW12B]QIK66701.1 glucose 1-dehydrogenase [Nocardioides sp. HDW12B]